jgi:hypothetical protein
MRKALLGSIAAVTAGAGFAAGQGPRGTPPAPVVIAPSVSGLMPGGGPDAMPGGPMIDPMMSGGMPSIGYQGGPGAGAPGGPGMGYPGGPGMGYPGGPGGPGMGYPGGPGGPGMGYPGGPMGYPPGGDAGLFGDAVGGGSAGCRWWFNAEYTLFFTRPQTGAPFVTSSAPADGGLVGNPTTSILYSTTDIGYNLISGFKIFGGVWRDADRRVGLELGGFMSGQKTVTFEASSDTTGQPLLARPFINATTGAQGALLVSFPNFASGSITVESDTRAFGYEINSISNWYRSCPGDGCMWNINALAGFRYMQVEEALNISQISSILPGMSVPFDGKNYIGPVNIGVADSFYTANRFYGGQIGLAGEVKWGQCFFNLTGKLALGIVHQHVNVNGVSTIFAPGVGAASAVNGGLYANPTNSGTFTNDEFAVLPEVSGGFGYNWCSWLTTSVGYDFMYLNKVVRPGDQYTTVVNPSVVPTSPNFGSGGAVPVPNPAGSQTYYWLQGVTFGLHIRY